MNKIITSAMFKLFSKAIYGVLLLCALTYNLHAQGDIPVDLQTGTAYVSIPLGSVSDNGINVPIVLNYTTTGIRVDEYEDWVGLGWSLNPGGLISREVRGLPDDYKGVGLVDTRLGWLHDTDIRQAVANFDTEATEAARWSEINSFYQNNKDTEPDLFYFSFAGGSGQFVFNKDGNIRLLSFTDLLIEFDGIDFSITDNSGVKYFFKTKETVTKQAATANINDEVELLVREYQLYKDALTYTSGWRLTKIESPEGGLVEFDYMTNTFEYETPVEVVTKEYNTTNYVDNELYTINFEKEVKLLEHIHSDVNSAYFVHEFFNFPAADSNPLPRKNHSYKLYRVYFSKSVEGKTLPLNSISFEYDTKISAKVSGISSARQFLTKVQTKNACDALPPYEFEYNSISLPPHGSNEQDVWGFYTANNKDQSNFIGTYLYPKTYVYPSLAPAYRYRFTQIPNQANEIIIEGNNRSATAAAKAGVLKKVHYPSGGSAELFYENNMYEESIATETIITNGPGVRVNKIVYEDGIPEGQLATPVSTAAITRLYSYGTGRLLHQPNYTIPSTYYHDRENGVERDYYQLLSDFGESASWDYLTLRTTQSLTAFGGVQYETASTYQTDQGSVTNMYDVPAYYGIDTHDDWQATTTFIVGNGVTDNGTLAEGTYAFPFPNNPNYGFERGQLMQKVMKAEDGKDVSLIDFTYNRLYKGTDEYKVNGIYLDGIRAAPGATDYTFLFGKYDIRTEVGTVLDHSENKTFDTNDNTQFQTTTVQNIYGTGNHRLLKEKTTTNPEGIKNITSYKYAVDYVFGATVTGIQSQMIKKLNDSRMGYRLVEQALKLEFPGETEKVVGGQLTLFKDYGDGIVRLHQQLLLKIGLGLTDFTDSYIGNGEFVYDSRYEIISTVEDYNTEGAITSASDNKKNKTGFHYGYDNHYGVVAISNSHAENVVFSNFETGTGHHFTYHTNRYLGNQVGGVAHTGQQSLELVATDVLVGTVNKDGNRAVFSTWVKAGAEGTLTLTLKTTDEITTLHTENLSFNATNESWELIEKEIDVTSFPAIYRIEITATTSGSAVMVDDVAFLPNKASIVTTTYDPINGKTSMIGATGITTYYSYDNLGRIKYMYDQDKNMVQANDYGFAKLDNTDKLSADFTREEVGYNGLPTTFKASISECLSEPIYYSWKIETDLDQNAYTDDDIIQVGSTIEGTDYSILTHTFDLDDALFPPGEDSRYFTVTLEVTYPGQRLKSETEVIKIVRFEPPVVTICASGLLQVDICGIEADLVTTCNGITTPDNGTTFALSSIEGGNPNADRTYQWQMKASGSSYWFSIGLPTTTSTSFNYSNLSESFDVRYMCKEATYTFHTITSYSNAIHVEVYRSTMGCAPSNGAGQIE